MKDRIFLMPEADEIKSGQTTDFYFINVEKILDGEQKNPRVAMEVYTRYLPYPDNWGIVSGIYESLNLLEGVPVDVWSMEEGELFLTSKTDISYEPVMRIEGRYRDFARYETALLGFLCSFSGVSTKAARMRFLAGPEKTLLSFGTRRAHPALAPMIERGAYIGGFDGFSNVLGAGLLGKQGSGTMPHSFILLYNDPRDAWVAFDKHVDQEIPRIALVDTYYDEKTESIMALETLGKRLSGVRLDTPGSRRGDWRKIAEEVRWELDQRGGRGIKIIISGGVDESDITAMNDVVDGYGIGTSVADAPTIDFNLKIVEVEMEGKMVKRSKRGDISGKKEAYRNFGYGSDIILPEGRDPPEGYEPLMKKWLERGKIIRKTETVEEIRERVMNRIGWVKDKHPSVKLIS
ncbi:MAG: nicotinate phosphoribosyltransferase [Nitrososphaerota archaeon]|jgi:nicotinate phosphoribosyltransferase|nr:nicotinate phosphoribosyltransferase [Nitrososphaerota archaeon]MDG6932685.1 nicotinate phosphoribosyltransferase [Nitrososphaerota archaeon]MDG6935472.1 nicotinate phosphoribosyltransferase [Nitrososphaerota archaeon]MDG6944137.1 nicotinate phosphoribosyltransferase [Nitrososphaerota archaeon]